LLFGPGALSGDGGKALLCRFGITAGRRGALRGGAGRGG
jgi:hypothetical protein